MTYLTNLIENVQDLLFDAEKLYEAPESLWDEETDSKTLQQRDEALKAALERLNLDWDDREELENNYPEQLQEIDEWVTEFQQERENLAEELDSLERDPGFATLIS